MSMQVSSGYVTFIAGSALGMYLRVKLSSGKVVLAGEADVAIGVTQSMAAADGDPVSVRLLKDAGTFFVVALSSLAAGAALQNAANGKVDDAGAGAAFGTALEAAGADGDIIEALPA